MEHITTYEPIRRLSTKDQEPYMERRLSNRDEVKSVRRLSTRDEPESGRRLSTRDQDLDRSSRRSSRRDSFSSTEDNLPPPESFQHRKSIGLEVMDFLVRRFSTSETQNEEVNGIHTDEQSHESMEVNGPEMGRRLSTRDEPDRGRRLSSRGEPGMERRLSSRDEPEMGRRLSSRDGQEMGRRLSSRDEPEMGRRLSSRDEPEMGRRLSSRDEPEMGRRLSSRDEPEMGRRLSSRDEPQTGRRLSSRDEPEMGRRLSSRDEPEIRRRLSSRDEPEIGRRLSSRDEPQMGRRLSSRDEPEIGRRLSSRGEPEMGRRLSSRDEPEMGRRLSSRDEPDMGRRLSSRDEPEMGRRLSSRDEPEIGRRPSYRDEPEKERRLSSRDELDMGRRLSTRDEPDKGHMRRSSSAASLDDPAPRKGSRGDEMRSSRTWSPIPIIGDPGEASSDNEAMDSESGSEREGDWNLNDEEQRENSISDIIPGLSQPPPELVVFESNDAPYSNDQKEMNEKTEEHSQLLSPADKGRRISIGQGMFNLLVRRFSGVPDETPPLDTERKSSISTGATSPKELSPRGSISNQGNKSPSGLSPRGSVSNQGNKSPSGLSPRGSVSNQGNKFPGGLSPRGSVSNQGNKSPSGLSPRGSMSNQGIKSPSGLSPRGSMSDQGNISPRWSTVDPIDRSPRGSFSEQINKSPRESFAGQVGSSTRGSFVDSISASPRGSFSDQISASPRSTSPRRSYAEQTSASPRSTSPRPSYAEQTSASPRSTSPRGSFAEQTSASPRSTSPRGSFDEQTSASPRRSVSPLWSLADQANRSHRGSIVSQSNKSPRGSTGVIEVSREDLGGEWEEEESEDMPRIPLATELFGFFARRLIGVKEDTLTNQRMSHPQSDLPDDLKMAANINTLDIPNEKNGHNIIKDMRDISTVTFCGCGFLGVYLVGAATYLQDHVPNLLKGRVAGSSFGSLVAVCVVCDIPLKKVRESILSTAKVSQKYFLGAMNPFFPSKEPLVKLLELLPEDAHIRASGRLFLSLTRALTFSNEIVSEYRTRDELIQALICSCFLPGVSGLSIPIFQGKRYVDGGLSNNKPLAGPGTLCINAFAGNFDIKPEEMNGNGFLTRWLPRFYHADLDLTNARKAVQAMYPPAPEVLDKYYYFGYADAQKYFPVAGGSRRKSFLDFF